MRAFNDALMNNERTVYKNECDDDIAFAINTRAIVALILLHIILLCKYNLFIYIQIREKKILCLPNNVRVVVL